MIDNMSKQQENKNTLGAQMEFIARITMPDGTVIEKKVSADGGIPSAEEMDLGSVDGFLKSFDHRKGKNIAGSFRRGGFEPYFTTVILRS